MTAIRRVLVLGASGDQGLPLLDSLIGAGFLPTAGVRRPDAMAGTRHAVLPAVRADLDDEESLVQAFAGQDALAMHLPFEFDRARAAGFGARIGAAARRAGLRKIVFNTSCFVADHDLGLSAHDGRRDIEAAIAASGVPYVVVRPVVFMDNMIRVWSKPSIVNSSIFAYPAAPDIRISWICLEDVAAYMTVALGRGDLTADRLLVGGPEALTGDEVAERLSAAAGRSIRFESLTPDAYASRMSLLVTGSPDVEPHGMYDRMARFYRWYNAQPVSPLAVDPGPALAMLPITPTPLLDWARRQDWNRV
jgi:NAD(P)H dehydrogenase (quinone)